MKFIKMQAAGNDYIYVVGGEEKEDYPALSQKYSDRRFGIGGDGIITVSPSTVADAKMRIFNADGSEGLTCGNGVRCAAYLAKKYLGVKGGKISVNTLSGTTYSVVETLSPSSAFVTADFCSPHPFASGEILAAEYLKAGLYIDKRDIFGINTGNLHVVCFSGISVDELRDFTEKIPLLQGKVNAETVRETDGGILAEVSERGSGKTLSCGSGAVASAYSYFLRSGDAGGEVAVFMPGGELGVKISGGRAFLSGKVEEVFKGETL